MKNVPANKQGHLDALCGIYALTNFLRDLKVDSRYFSAGRRDRRSDDAFWLLLDVAYRCKMLSPDYLLEGYAPHHLVKIWNTLSAEADLRCESVLLSKLKRLGNTSTFDVVEAVLTEPFANGFMIRSEGHWYLCTSVSKSTINVVDSMSRAADRESLSKSTIQSRDTDGFALLMNGSKILDCVRAELDG